MLRQRRYKKNRRYPLLETVSVLCVRVEAGSTEFLMEFLPLPHTARGAQTVDLSDSGPRVRVEAVFQRSSLNQMPGDR